MAVNHCNDVGGRPARGPLLIHPAQSNYENGHSRSRRLADQLHTDGIGIAEDALKAKGVRVRITVRPRERDIEGMSLDTLRPGSVCDVSASIGSWLIVKGYAYPEMRSEPEEDETPARPVKRDLSDRRRK